MGTCIPTPQKSSSYGRDRGRAAQADKLGLEPIDQLGGAQPRCYDLGGDAFDLESPTGSVLRLRPTERRPSAAPSPGGAVARAFSSEDAKEAPDDDDADSMALFAKKKIGGDKTGAKDNGTHMQGHVYFAAMLGILITHGNTHLIGLGDPAHPAAWAGMNQLRANLDASFGLPLYFAVAGVADARAFEKRRGERQSAKEMLKPLALVYGTMVILDALTHVTYEGFRRNLNLEWRSPQPYPYPAAPKISRLRPSSPPRNIHVVTAAPPRPAFAPPYPRNIHVVAAPPPPRNKQQVPDAAELDENEVVRDYPGSRKVGGPRASARRRGGGVARAGALVDRVLFVARSYGRMPRGRVGSAGRGARQSDVARLRPTSLFLGV